MPSENKNASLDGDVLYNPLCIDAECIRDGYATTVMTENRCQSAVDCGVYHDIGTKMKYIDGNISQRCSAEAFLKGATDVNDIGPRNNVDPVLIFNRPQPSKTHYYLGIKLVSIVLVGILMYQVNALRMCLSFGKPVCYGVGTTVALIMLWLLTLTGQSEPETGSSPIVNQPVQQYDVPINGKRWGACIDSKDCEQPNSCYSTGHYAERGEIKGRCMSDTDCVAEGGKTCNPV